MDITEEIRLKNARALARCYDSNADFARQIGREPTQVSRFMGKNPTKSISNKIARDIEKHCGKPRGWLDQPHDESEQTKTNEVADDNPSYNAGEDINKLFYSLSASDQNIIMYLFCIAFMYL